MAGLREATLTVPDAPLTFTDVLAPTDRATDVAETLSSAASTGVVAPNMAHASARIHVVQLFIVFSPRITNRAPAAATPLAEPRAGGACGRPRIRRGRHARTLATKPESDLNECVVPHINW